MSVIIFLSLFHLESVINLWTVYFSFLLFKIFLLEVTSRKCQTMKFNINSNNAYKNTTSIEKY